MQGIIPYQVITGNYNRELKQYKGFRIIPYQVITGNYNIIFSLVILKIIICGITYMQLEI